MSEQTVELPEPDDTGSEPGELTAWWSPFKDGNPLAQRRWSGLAEVGVKDGLVWLGGAANHPDQARSLAVALLAAAERIDQQAAEDAADAIGWPEPWLCRHCEEPNKPEWIRCHNCDFRRAI